MREIPSATRNPSPGLMRAAEPASSASTRIVLAARPFVAVLAGEADRGFLRRRWLKCCRKASSAAWRSRRKFA